MQRSGPTLIFYRGRQPTSAKRAERSGEELFRVQLPTPIQLSALALSTPVTTTKGLVALLHHGDKNLRNSRRKSLDMNYNSGLIDTQKEREMNKETGPIGGIGEPVRQRNKDATNTCGTAQRVESAQEQEIRDKIKAADREFTLKQVGAAIAVLRPNIVATLDALQGQISGAMVAQGFWQCNNTGEKIALMHSELSEALEGDRKKKRDEHLPGFDSVTVELADTVIRILDFAGYHGLDLGEAIVQKMQYNLGRSFMHGKKY